MVRLVSTAFCIKLTVEHYGVADKNKSATKLMTRRFETMMREHDEKQFGKALAKTPVKQLPEHCMPMPNKTPDGSWRVGH